MLSLNTNDDEIGLKNKNYIKQLSIYFRKVLEVNSKDRHSLEDELEFTEEYLKLQQHIIKKSFQYQINIEDKFDTYSVDIPTMLLQPYVENCLKHGFEGVEYEGLIKINCKKVNGKSIIEIEDNGKGLNGNNKIKGGGRY